MAQATEHRAAGRRSRRPDRAIVPGAGVLAVEIDAPGQAVVSRGRGLAVVEFSYVYPGQELCESGDRRGGCALYDRARRDRTGSMLGERR